MLAPLSMSLYARSLSECQAGCPESLLFEGRRKRLCSFSRATGTVSTSGKRTETSLLVEA